MTSVQMFKTNFKYNLAVRGQSLTIVIVSMVLSTQAHLLCHQMSTGWWTHWCILNLWKTISRTQFIEI